MSQDRGLRPHQVVGYEFVPPNILINPGFDIWQRGNTFNSHTAGFTADEWNSTLIGGGPLNITRDSGAYIGDYCLKFDWTKGAGTYSYVNQGIENYKSLEGQWLTFSAWVKTNNIIDFELRLSDYNGSAQTAWARSTAANQWQRLTVTKQIRTGLTTYPAWPHGFGIDAMFYTFGTAITYVDGASLVVGKYPEGIPYIPLNPAEDWTRCQRFYETHEGPYSVPQIQGGYASSASQNVIISAAFNTRKMVTPTITISGTWNVSNGTGPDVYGQSASGYALRVLSSAAGRVSFSPDSSDDAVRAEVT